MTLRPQLRAHKARAILLFLVTIFALPSCNRTLYRRQADREANYLVREKSVGTPWQVPDTYTIQPDPRSRFFDPTDPDFPTLPPAGPHLYQYQLPLLERAESLPSTLPDAAGPAPELPSPMPVPDQPPEGSPGVSGIAAPAGPIQLVAYQQDAAHGPVPAAPPDPFLEYVATLGVQKISVKELEPQPIGSKYWRDVPDNCLSRMLEFDSVRTEYEDTFDRAPDLALLETAPRVSLRELFDLALLNSREYQRQKEILYERALDVSLERFAYATKFSARGGTVDTTYTHLRSNGTTINSLAVPSTIAGNKLLATGGTLVGQFANDILLTFNGPTGFAADVSSELLLQITQSVFQRDILLEPLIQSERNLVYGARDFTRFRKEFFLDVASEYYGILREYRAIEIQAQNYFAQVRNLQQALKEVESKISTAPNIIFLNQFEQSVLRARSDLIRDCNQLELSLDDMKIAIGLPTETLINIDLAELDQLTLRDMIEVSREQASRWFLRLNALYQAAEEENHADMLSADYALAERLIKWLWDRGQVMRSSVDPRAVFMQRVVFQLDAARLDLLEERQALNESQSATPPKQRILIFQRQIEVIESELMLILRQIEYADALRLQDESLLRDKEMHRGFHTRFEDLLLSLSNALEGSPDDQVIIDLIDQATSLLAESETVSQDLDILLFGQHVQSVDWENTLARTKELILVTEQVFDEAGNRLPAVDISVDEAMITALVQRLDLMNERGSLADDWRDVKIAADELRSNLNLTASQSFRNDRNRPFDFSTDNATTRLGMSWDLPLNRKQERNFYRRTLINYNVGLRGLMQFEDGIKRNIRAQLRNLVQAREQYPISVASAALAEEQVMSTRLQLLLGMQDVRASDLVEAYNQSREALGAMVDLRIGYILERARFALELEDMMLDDTGFWPLINDPEYQPEPNGAYPWNAGCAYGDYPSYLKVSREYRRMLGYPPPGAGPDSLPAPDAAQSAADQPGKPEPEAQTPPQDTGPPAR